MAGALALRVVIAHDFAETFGGAERVTREMAIAFPDAPIVAFLVRPEVAARMGVADRMRGIIPAGETVYRHYRLLTPLYGTIARASRLPPADVVLSSSYAFAHRLRAPGAVHVCYCHSALRFAWSMTESYRRTWTEGELRGRAFGALAAAVRRGDRRAAQRVDSYLTQSAFTADQIARFYGREAQVIGAPVDCTLFTPSGAPPDDFFLLAGRIIEPYKRVGVALEAFRALPGERLLVAGRGPDLEALRAIAPPNVTFLGQLDDAALPDLMQRCRALIFPSRDDFGLMPVEAMACGRPVIAFAGGGARHTVVAGKTGTFFETQTPEALATAVREFRDEDYDAAAVRAHAEQWDSPRFRERLVDAVRRAYARGPSRPRR